MRCPVLAYGIVLRTRYALSGTRIRCRATHSLCGTIVRTRYALSAVLTLVLSYALAMRCPGLTYRTRCGPRRQAPWARRSASR
eukprot:64190-Rhodomonas_salina.1